MPARGTAIRKFIEMDEKFSMHGASIVKDGRVAHNNALCALDADEPSELNAVRHETHCRAALVGRARYGYGAQAMEVAKRKSLAVRSIVK